MSTSARHLRTGSDAGRGFRFQDAVAALIAVQLWERNAPGMIIPEGGDDIERRTGAQRDLISVKSRRHGRGLFRPSDIREHVAQLDRRSRAEDSPELELILERDVTEDARCVAGPAIALTILPSPREDAVALVVERLGCWPVAAEIAVAKLQDRLGDLADENGPLPITERLGLGAAEVDKLLSDAVSSINHEALEEAIRSRLIEAVDFNTRRDEPSFYSGVDVEPGHLAAGLVVSRPTDGEAVEDALDARGRAIICGPSGAGKSAVMWQVTRATKHTIRWYRLFRLEDEDIGALNRFLGGLRISLTSPIGIVLDDAGRRLPEAWGKMLDISHRTPGLVLLASCREEDLARLRTADTPLLRPNATEDLAKALWEKLRNDGLTTWAGWREPWESAAGLLMEFTHTLSTRTRLREVLREQLSDRIADPNRDLETDILRIVACTHATGARVSVKRLSTALGVTTTALARAFERLVQEHLVRAEEDGLVGPLHQLRSAVILEEAHASGAAAMGDTLAASIESVHADDLSILLADINVGSTNLIDRAIAAVASRINATCDPALLSQGLRGLAFLEAKGIAERWQSTNEVKALPVGQRPVAAMLGLSGADLSGEIYPDVLTKAVQVFASQAEMQESRLRVELLNRCKPELIGQILNSVNADTVRSILGTMIGIGPLPGQVRAAILGYVPDLTPLPLEDVVGLLETLIELDRNLATDWIDHVAPHGLIGRIENEIPWTTLPRLQKDDEIIVASCAHVHIADDIVSDAHESVVSLCRHLFALAPQVDRADVEAVDANGIRLAIGDFDVAAKRMPRSALPPKSLTDWNRTIVNAVTTSSELETRTAFLAEALRISVDLAPTLEGILDRVVRGKPPIDRDLTVFGNCHEAARDLTSPIGPFADRAKGETDVFAELQDALFFASADLVRRYAGLPEGANALAAHCGTKAQKLREAIADPMWYLLPEVAFGPLLKIANILEGVRVVAWDHGRRSARANNPRPQVKKAAKRNAVRTASRLASCDIDLMAGRLVQELESTMVEEGLNASIFLRPVDPDSVPGAASGVVVLVEVTALEEILVAAPLVFELLRSRVPRFTELTVLPLYASGHLIRFGLGGFENPLPLFGGKAAEQVEEILHAQNIPLVPLPVHDLTNEAISTAVAIGNFIRAGRGGQGQPKIERDTLQMLEAELGVLTDQLKEKLGDLSGLLESALDEARQSGLGSNDFKSLVSGGPDLEGTYHHRTTLALAAVSIDLDLDFTEDDSA